VKKHFQDTLFNKKKTTGKGKGVEPLLSISSRRNIWVVFNMAMKWALVEGLIAKSPGVAEAKPVFSRTELSRKQVEQLEFDKKPDGNPGRSWQSLQEDLTKPNGSFNSFSPVVNPRSSVVEKDY
jgi:hypothetical protein